MVLLRKMQLFGHKHPLRSIMMIGLGARFLFVFLSNHVYYPDEIYQTLEQSFRLINSYGLIPWEYTAQIRSWITPGLLAIPLYAFKTVGITDPAIYGKLISLLLALLSVSLIPACYYLAALAAPPKHRQLVGLTAAGLAAIWYELIYFASRASYESLATSIMALSAWLLFGKNHRPLSRMHAASVITSGLLAGLGILIRPHYLVAFLSMLAYVGYIKKIADINRFGFGFLSALLIGGIVDLATSGTFLGSYLAYFSMQLNSNVSDVFGTQPTSYYVSTLAKTSAGLVLVTLPSLAKRKNWWLWATYASLLLIHSLSPHKEYRFIFAALPLQLALVTCGVTQLVEWFHPKEMRTYIQIGLPLVTLTISLLAFAQKLPHLESIYPKPLLWRDPLLQTFNELHQAPHLCGINDRTRLWPTSPSYYFLNRYVPLYTQDVPPPDLDNANYMIALIENKEQLLHNQQPNCVPDPNYTYERELEYVEAAL